MIIFTFLVSWQTFCYTTGDLNSAYLVVLGSFLLQDCSKLDEAEGIRECFKILHIIRERDLLIHTLKFDGKVHKLRKMTERQQLDF